MHRRNGALWCDDPPCGSTSKLGDIAIVSNSTPLAKQDDVLENDRVAAVTTGSCNLNNLLLSTDTCATGTPVQQSTVPLL